MPVSTMVSLESLRALLEGLSGEGMEELRRSLRLDVDEQVTAERLLEVCTPTFLGPTWLRNGDGSWRLPEATLGWECAGWATKWLRNPSDPSQPWRFTLEQLRFLLWWYAVDDGGEFVYRKGVLQRRKGWGKDPLLAVICLIEMVGPCRFDHWSATGDPIGKACQQALVQVSAVTATQTSNTSDMFPLLMSDGFIAKYSVKPGIEVIRALGGTRKIEMVTGSYRAIEGKRATFTVLNETQHWVPANGGSAMYKTIKRNAAKLRGNRFLSITNAYRPGDGASSEMSGSVGQVMRETWEAENEGRAQATGFLYDSVEAHPRAPLYGPLLPYVLEPLIGDATWTSVTDVIADINDISTPPAEARRMWLNQIVAEGEGLVAPEDIRLCEDDSLVLEPGDQIVLGLDGAVSDDSTALVAVRPRDMAVFLLGCWGRWEEDGHEGYVVDQDLVSDQVDAAVRMYDVAGFYSDVSYWESYVWMWTEKYAPNLLVQAKSSSPIGLDMRGNQEKIVRANERLVADLRAGNVKLSPDRRIRRHLLNVRRRENRYGVSFGKESRSSRRKIDAYAALLLAYEAAVDFRLRGATREGSSRGWFF